ncbi:MAG: DUF1697 domain-containing protein [Gemmatimonadaceae bacterium]
MLITGSQVRVLSRELIPTHIALLRAVNVGGTGKLPMAELRALCAKAGLKAVRTYIASGNVVGASPLASAAIKARLEKALLRRLGKPCRVLVRSLAELEAVERRNPFPDAPPGYLLVIFLDEAPPKSSLKAVRIPGKERLTLIGRELYIHYPDGMGKSRLRTPLADIGTGRNLNTVRALIAMANGDA